MKRTFFVLAITFSLVGCHGKSPTGPDGGGGGGGTIPPDQSQYETLPAKKYLTEYSPENGNQLRMWIELVSVDPLRGSAVNIGRRFCPDGGCFRAVVRVGIDPADNENRASDGNFWLEFRQDTNESPPTSLEMASSLKYFSGPGVNSSGPQQIEYGPWYFDAAHKYIVVWGRQELLTQWDHPRWGRTEFFIDYKTQ